ncbi:MAG: peptidase M14 [Leptospira sp.]|nr:peptidase M14 [Leptospira sp.]NCS94736.1 peptidase M14 [Leptospira sp.]
MRSNLFYLPNYNRLKSHIYFIIRIVIFFFALIPMKVHSIPIQDLDNPSHYRFIKISKDIYPSMLPFDEIVQVVKIKEVSQNIYLLIPKNLEIEWRKRNLKYSILIYPKKFSEIDPAHKIRFNNGCISSREMLNGYKNNRLNELYLSCIEDEFPGLVKKVSLGLSAGQRNISALQIRIPQIQLENPKKELISDRDKIFIHCSIHSNEIISTEHCYDIIQYILISGLENPILQKLEIWIVPIMNPDGSESYWKDSTNKGRKNGNEVDLNRNFPFQWNSGSSKASSGNPTSAFYRGNKPGSEPEIKALLSLFEEHRFFFSLSYHCYANSLLIPYSIEELQNPEPNLLATMGNRLTKGIFSYRQDKEFLAKKNLYEVDGTDQDTFFHNFGTYAYLVESSHRVENYQKVPLILEGFRPIFKNLLTVYNESWKIRLKIQNEKGIPVQAKIRNNAFEYFEEEILESNTAGIFNFIAPNSNKVKFEIEARGYQNKIVEISPSKDLLNPILISMKKAINSNQSM